MNLGIGVPLEKVKRLQYACPNVYAIGTNTKYPDQSFKLKARMLAEDTMIGMLTPENNLPPRKAVASNAPHMSDPM